MTRAGLAVAVLLLVTACGAGATPTPTAAPTTGAPQVQPPVSTPLAEPPDQPSGDGTVVTLETNLGDISIEVFNVSAPVASENFVNLAEAGYYDRTVFHRVIPGFVVQGGSPDGTGSGGPGYTIQDDAVVGDYVRGIVAMARPARPDGALIPDSQGSQFFIVLDDLRADLPEEGMYAIFGRVTEGMEVVDEIAASPTDPQDRPVEPVIVERASVTRA